VTELVTQFVHFLPLTPDHDPWAGGVDGDADPLRLPLNLDKRYRCFLKALQNVCAEHLVFLQKSREVAPTVPARFPKSIRTFGSPEHSESKSRWMSFLSH
jgi:hypothetical protein